ncbi:MAG TPA: GTP 3',8-cyclase MoaA [Thermoanaerobaculia bacterium]|nr:GTP 3',8-cyclase MoaA [Thermoanaerobaculia bacterium]
MAIQDRLGRPLGNLRVSVTDRCNLRCAYCMPERDYVWLPRRDILDFEEVGLLADVFGSLGIDRIRLTGGEPLVRQDLPTLVRTLAGKPWLRDLAMTTNGVLLEDHAAGLKAAGLHRVTVSLDTLRPDRFRELARFDELPRVLRGIEAAAAAGFAALKLDTVVIRGVNDDEIVALLERAKGWGAEARFIEYMDVGGATHWSREKVLSRQGILRAISDAYGPVEPIDEKSSAPAERFRLPDGTAFGVIASTTAPFCRACDRSRLTADGLWYLCLYAAQGLDLRKPLRAGASAEQLRALIAGAWTFRADRGAEERLGLRERSPLLPAADLQKDPHLEMHTRGG